MVNVDGYHRAVVRWPDPSHITIRTPPCRFYVPRGPTIHFARFWCGGLTATKSAVEPKAKANVHRAARPGEAQRARATPPSPPARWQRRLQALGRGCSHGAELRCSLSDRTARTFGYGSLPRVRTLKGHGGDVGAARRRPQPPTRSRRPTFGAKSMWGLWEQNGDVLKSSQGAFFGFSSNCGLTR